LRRLHEFRLGRSFSSLRLPVNRISQRREFGNYAPQLSSGAGRLGRRLSHPFQFLNAQ
jgi:hypothetical protein